MYVKVVLENLLDQTSLYDLEEELRNEYREDLDSVRAGLAACFRPCPYPGEGSRVEDPALGCLCGSSTEMGRDTMFCIDAGSGSCNPLKMKMDGCKSLCGSLVETKPCHTSPDSPFEANIVVSYQTAIR